MVIYCRSVSDLEKVPVYSPLTTSQGEHLITLIYLVFMIANFLKSSCQFAPFVECSGSVDRALEWGLLVQASPLVESLCCVLEQDTLSAAEYWFNPGRPVLT